MRILRSLARTPWGIANAFSRLTFDKNIEQKLARALQESNPDVVIVTEPWLLAYTAVIRKHVKTLILDLHNIEQCLYASMLRSDCRMQTKAKAWLLLRVAKILESRFCNEADGIWVCSDYDATVLKDTYDISRKVYSVPSGIDTQYYCDARCPPPSDNTGKLSLLYCANFSYDPNAIAAGRLLKTILPLVRERFPDCTLMLAGASPTASMRSAADAGKGIIVTGAVADMRPYLQMQHAVYVIPLTHGSGTRLKILEAFAAGIPVVSTGKGVEGLHIKHDQELLIAETDEEFADAISKLHNDGALRRRLCSAARLFIEKNASLETVSQSVVRACRFAAAAPSA